MRIPREAMFGVLERIGLEPEDKGDYFLLRCPSCGHKEMYLYRKSSRMTCNRQNKCGEILNVYDYIKEFKNLDISTVQLEEASKLFEEEKEKDEEEFIFPEGMGFFAETKKGIFRDRAMSYLLERGISSVRALQTGYIYQTSSLYDKTIFFPFYENGNFVFFVCRDFTDKRFKRNSVGELERLRYINPRGKNSGEYVFQIDEIKEDGNIFIFEGLMDALMLDEQTGTASLKSFISKTQASKIWNKAPGKIILVPDNDKAGRKSLIINVAMIERYRPPSLKSEVLIYDIPKQYKDFNDTGLHFIDIKKCHPYEKSRALKLFDWKIKAPI